PSQGELSTPAPLPPHKDPGRLGRVAALVGIVAGVVFVVAMVSFSGFFIGRVSTRQYDREPREVVVWRVMSPGGMGPGGMLGPGGMCQPSAGPSGPATSFVPTTPRP